MHLGLDRRGRTKQQVPRASSNAQHEVKQIIWLILSHAQTAASAGTMGFIEYYRPVPALEQVLAFVGVVEDEPGRHDSNL